MRKFTIATTALMAAHAHAAPQTEYSWRCDFPTVQSCGPDGCTTITPAKGKAVWLFLDPSGSMYYRCVGEGFENCGRYTARVIDSGAFKVFELPGAGAFVKVGDDLAATEVVSIMHSVMIKRGKCESGPPPLVRTPTR